MILKSEYCERIDNKVVNEPAPAISGNTTGVKVASLPVLLLERKISKSSTISMAITKIIIEPATANEDISRLNSPKNASPIYIKPINNISDIMLAREALTMRPLRCKFITTGRVPMISMIANKTINAPVNCVILKVLIKSSNILYFSIKNSDISTMPPF